MAKVAVIMPVYNGEQFLQSAIDSVLAQSFQDFRFIIVDDGSTDNSVKTIKSYADKRIELLVNEKNAGIAYSLNRAMRMVDEEYIARMDCDDVCHPDRLRQQLKFMQRNDAIGICGTRYRTIGSGRMNEYRGPCKSEEIRASMVFSNPIAHPTVMMRTNHIRVNHLEYSTREERNEDYDLWQRASECFPLENIPKTLLYYRIRKESVSNRLRSSAPSNNLRVLEGVYRRGLGWLGIAPTGSELQLHFEIANKQFINRNRLAEYESWLILLKHKNQQQRVFDLKIFEKIIQDNWFEICYAALEDKSSAVAAYFRSELRRNMIGFREGKLALKSLLRSR